MRNRRDERQAKEKELKESIIVEAAGRLFSLHGFDAVTMDQVASEAGFSKATLYKIFPSKHTLLFRIVCHAVDLCLADAARIAADVTREPEGALREVIFLLIDRFRQGLRQFRPPANSTFLFDQLLFAADQEQIEHVVASEKAYVEVIESLLKRCEKRQTVWEGSSALALFLMLHGFMRQVRVVRAFCERAEQVWGDSEVEILTDIGFVAILRSVFKPEILASFGNEVSA